MATSARLFRGWATGPGPTIDNSMDKRMANQVWRMCVGCRKRDPITVLVRVARSLDEANALVFDLAKRLPGRGAWVHPTAVCVSQAISRKAFSRALRHHGELDTSGLERLT